jgi:hypothetical protein
MLQIPCFPFEDRHQKFFFFIFTHLVFVFIKNQIATSGGNLWGVPQLLK